MNITQAFTFIGLKEQHALIYSALLEEGSLNPSQISSTTGIPRSSCYDYLEEMQSLNLIFKPFPNETRFMASDPKRIKDLYKIYTRKLASDDQFFWQEYEIIEKLYKSSNKNDSIKYITKVESIYRILHGFKGTEVFAIVVMGDEDDISRPYRQILKELFLLNAEKITRVFGQDPDNIAIKIYTSTSIYLLNPNKNRLGILSDPDIVALEKGIVK